MADVFFFRRPAFFPTQPYHSFAFAITKPASKPWPRLFESPNPRLNRPHASTK